MAKCRQRRPSFDSEREGCFSVPLYVLNGEGQQHPMGLEKPIHFVARGDSNKAASLSNSELARTEPFERKRLQRRPGQTGGIFREQSGQVFRKFECHLHGGHLHYRLVPGLTLAMGRSF